MCNERSIVGRHDEEEGGRAQYPHRRDDTDSISFPYICLLFRKIKVISRTYEISMDDLHNSLHFLSNVPFAGEGWMRTRSTNVRRRSDRRRRRRKESSDEGSSSDNSSSSSTSDSSDDDSGQSSSGGHSNSSISSTTSLDDHSLSSSRLPPPVAPPRRATTKIPKINALNITSYQQWWGM